MKNANKVILLCMYFFIQSIADDFVYNNGVYSCFAKFCSSSCRGKLSLMFRLEFMEEKDICNFPAGTRNDVLNTCKPQ